MEKYSKLMALASSMGLKSVAWSLRRLYCPVKKDDLVLEVGSGGNPYYRANILLDAYYETRERHYQPLVADRPTVLGFVENLPFKDNTFDFVIASNVLEHSYEPEKFLEEIQRVGRAGYIEVPDAFFERLHGYRDHKLEITDVEGELLIRKKEGYIQDLELQKLFQNKLSSIFDKLMAVDPFKFSVIYYWNKDEGGIKYTVLNKEYEFDWTPPIETKTDLEKYEKVPLTARLKMGLLQFARYCFSQHSRNKNINYISLLRCPNCFNEELKASELGASCDSCGRHYNHIAGNVLKLN